MPIQTYYHGTCPESASKLIKDGWNPQNSFRGGNFGNPRYLYLSSSPEDALWFAQEKGCHSVLKIHLDPQQLHLDPDDSLYSLEYWSALKKGDMHQARSWFNKEPHPVKVIATKFIDPKFISFF